MKRDCPICGATYDANPVRLRHGRQTTCSRSCSYKLRASGLSNSRSLTCSTCGAEFSRTPAQIKSKHQGVYCSRECHYKGRTLGITSRVVSQPYNITAEVDYSAASRKAWATRRENGTDRHSEATCEKLRLATARQIAANGGRQVSKVEDKVAEALTSLGVGFVRQFAVRDPASGQFCGLPDFLLNDGSVLEVNGTFWHADIRTFPDGPVYPSQERTAKRYARKLADFDRLGIKVREVWEADFAEDGIDAVRAALMG